MLFVDKIRIKGGGQFSGGNCISECTSRVRIIVLLEKKVILNICNTKPIQTKIVIL